MTPETIDIILDYATIIIWFILGWRWGKSYTENKMKKLENDK